MSDSLAGDRGKYGCDYSAGKIHGRIQRAARTSQLRFWKPGTHKSQSHAALADCFAVSARGLRIGYFPRYRISLNQRDRSGQVNLVARETAVIINQLFLSRRHAFQFAERIEPSKFQAAVVAQELMQAGHLEYDC